MATRESVGWLLMKRVFVPLVIAAIAVGVVASVLLGCSTHREVANPKPLPPATLTQKISRTVQVKVTCTAWGGSGSGVVLVGDKWGTTWIATAEHVASSDKCFYSVVFPDGRTFIAERGPHDDKHDLALLKVPTGTGKDFDLLEEAHGKLGDEVHVTGFPFDCYKWNTELSVSFGHISTMYKDRKYQYRTSANFIGGNSGGPAWSPEGHLIGITNAGWVYRHGGKCQDVPMDGHYYLTSAEYVFRLLRTVHKSPDDPHPHF